MIVYTYICVHMCMYRYVCLDMYMCIHVCVGVYPDKLPERSLNQLRRAELKHLEMPLSSC